LGGGSVWGAGLFWGVSGLFGAAGGAEGWGEGLGGFWGGVWVGGWGTFGACEEQVSVGGCLVSSPPLKPWNPLSPSNRSTPPQKKTKAWTSCSRRCLPSPQAATSRFGGGGRACSCGRVSMPPANPFCNSKHEPPPPPVPTPTPTSTPPHPTTAPTPPLPTPKSPPPKVALLGTGKAKFEEALRAAGKVGFPFFLFKDRGGAWGGGGKGAGFKSGRGARARGPAVFGGGDRHFSTPVPPLKTDGAIKQERLGAARPAPPGPQTPYTPPKPPPNPTQLPGVASVVKFSTPQTPQSPNP
jgi:hypothetical protein